MSEQDAIREQLEYLRGEIRAERISYSGISDLQGLAQHIDPSDVELLEWAGVPEFPPTCDLCGKQDGPGEPDWNGETGNHVTCEREAAYAKSVTDIWSANRDI